jgi:general secretion pathway protein E
LREDLTERLGRVLAGSEPSSEQASAEEPIEAQALLRDALDCRASDVHLDPGPDAITVRFRIDGVLIDVGRFAPEPGKRLINQLKTMAELDPVATFTPEQARFTIELDEAEYDLRLGLAPCMNGQKLTLRALEPNRVRQQIHQLGLRDADRESARQWLEREDGMLLVTGPTGSGKTTTLYAMLHEMKGLERNVMTIEEPVEYLIEGINQMQIDMEHGLNFAEGIHSMLRLDPDYMVVGEMRDEASARSAADAAVTGVPLLSTLHSRDAVGTITVLRNFGFKDHEIAAVLSVVVAQRLVRRLCEHCREQAEPSDEQKRWLESVGAEVPETVGRASGCEHCRNLGYLGRVGVFELWPLDHDDRAAILAHAPESELSRTIEQRDHHRHLLADGLEKASDGVTSLEELRTVV